MTKLNTKLILNSIKSELIPGEVEYAVLLPPGYDNSGEPLPLLLNMHGGGLDRNFLADPLTQELYENLWASGALPPMVVACYSARGGWHLNYHDKSELWEDFAFEFIQLMQQTYNTHPGQAYNYLTGISMGAMGALRLTLKYPDRFGAVAAMEGVLNPVLNYDDLQPRNYGMQHNLPPEEQAKRWGWPVDRDFYHANNHANIARDNAETIREHGPKIYLECGDHDYYNGHDGAEFVHRVLWKNRIEHEYRLLNDCDHVGASLGWRIEDAHRWLGRAAEKLINGSALPEPTAEQQHYMDGLFRGQVTAPPTAKERIEPLDDREIVAHRRALPDFLKRYANDPLGGVFRQK